MWWDYWPTPFFGPLFMFAMMVLCMGVMMFMMRSHRQGGGARSILDERYARGEISQVEYDERKRVLRS